MMSSKQDRSQHKDNEARREKADAYKLYIKTSAVGLEIGLSVIVGVLAGFFSDRYFKIAPWGIILGFIVGSTAAARRLYRFAKQYLQENAVDNDLSQKRGRDDKYKEN